MTGSEHLGPQFDDYRGAHTAPGPDYGAPMHHLKDFYPDDIYGPRGRQIYGEHFHGQDALSRDEEKVFRDLHQSRGKPDHSVWVYRAIPKGVEPGINPGDWVSPSKGYAHQHGQGVLGGDYQISSRRARAKELWTDANSVNEWGWHPSKDPQ